jgi:hypothetical protein
MCVNVLIAKILACLTVLSTVSHKQSTTWSTGSACVQINLTSCANSYVAFLKMLNTNLHLRCVYQPQASDTQTLS